jgi:hypothetical protein
MCVTGNIHATSILTSCYTLLLANFIRMAAIYRTYMKADVQSVSTEPYQANCIVIYINTRKPDSIIALIFLQPYGDCNVSSCK